MGRVMGLLGVLIAMAVGAYVYSHQAQAVTPGGAGNNPRAVIDVAGVRNDLIAIAGAERRHFASDGKYVSIDELMANGDISMQRKNRGPYSYDAEIGDSSFRITATYSGDPQANVPSRLSIDDTMQIQTE